MGIRRASRPQTSGLKTALTVDGYAGYRALERKNSVQLAFCWSHVRRRFYELAAAGPAPIASEALERIAGLYAIEKDIRGCGLDVRRATREDESRPILVALEPWLREKLALISQKSKLAEAIRYALSRWNGLTLSMTAASRSIPMSSNAPSLRSPLYQRHCHLTHEGFPFGRGADSLEAGSFAPCQHL